MTMPTSEMTAPANSSAETSSSHSVTELLGGIVNDLQDLGLQHLTLFRHEVKEDLRKATVAGASLAIGVAVAQVGALLLGLMFSHLLMELAPNLPMWVSYGVVGVAFAASGGIGIYSGYKKSQTIDTLSPQAAEIIKDDAKWLTTTK